jgi:protein TonB
MSSYTGNSRPRDRAKAIAAVVAIHLVLAVVILAGLNVGKVQQVVDRLQTIEIPAMPPPPPRRRPPQTRRASAAAGKPAPRAEPSPVVAPAPKLPSPSPVQAAPAAGQGSAASAGATNAGTGAGGIGSGTGTGGNGAGFTPARLVRNIPSFEYDRLASTGMPSGLVGVTLLVGPDGRPDDCRIARSSGQATLDVLVCQLTLRYVRFAPARDPQGRAIAQDITYFPNWRRR